jgi:hypothetical protein
MQFFLAIVARVAMRSDGLLSVLRAYFDWRGALR